jgi:hypothetical protein
VNIDNHIKFRELSGERVYKAGKTYWFEARSRVYNAFPSHVNYKLNEEEINSIFKNTSALFVRYPCDLKSLGVKSYRIICNDKNYSINSLSSNTRSKVRRGLKNFSVKNINININSIQNRSIDIIKSTLKRQNRNISSSLESDWATRCKAISNVEGVEVWGAYSNFDGILAAFVVVYQIDNCIYPSIIRSDQKYLKKYCNNVLIFSILENYLKRPDVDLVNYGLEPIRRDMDGLDSFKKNMGFKKQLINQNIIPSPKLKPMLNIFSKWIVKVLVHFNPKNDFYKKAEGIFHYYGK